MVLYMKPGAVWMERAVADGAQDRPGRLTRDASLPDGHYSPSGVFGDATLATWQKGETITEGLFEDILKEIDALAALAVPAATSPSSPTP
jgi:creatinine amidohydrolase/Fe(II)-dependent formamide hydrolase-like protein